MLDDVTMIRHILRMRRTLRDGTELETSSSRRKAFSAGMQQFEEQLDSAKVVSPLTRPINLYYGLVQAGLAMQAAYAPGTWTFDKHGLKPVNLSLNLQDIEVGPSGNGAFQAVSNTTQSPTLSAPVTIGAIWASLADLCDTADIDSSSPRALYLVPELPASLWPNSEETNYPGPRANLYLEPAEFARVRDSGKFGEFISRYPGLNGAAVVGDLNKIEIERNGRVGVQLEWPNPTPSQPLIRDSTAAFFDERAPNYRYHQNRRARPLLAPNFHPTPLMSWWLLLYLFSILARYQPRKWLDILDFDNSELAAPVSFALDIAMEAIPQLVLEALDKHPVLLSRPMMFVPD